MLYTGRIKVDKYYGIDIYDVTQMNVKYVLRKSQSHGERSVSNETNTLQHSNVSNSHSNTHYIHDFDRL